MKIFDEKQQFDYRKKLVSYVIMHNNKSKTAIEFKCDIKTVSKWLTKYIKFGNKGLKNKSRRPHCSPNKISKELEDNIIGYRKLVPAYGPVRLKDNFDIPCHINTIGKVLKRNHLTIPHKKRSKKRADMRAIKKLYKPYENIQIDVKYLTDIAKYYPYIQHLGLPKYQYTARDVRTGALFLGYADSVNMTYASIFVRYLLNHLQLNNNLIKFNTTREYVRGFADNSII